MAGTLPPWCCFLVLPQQKQQQKQHHSDTAMLPPPTLPAPLVFPHATNEQLLHDCTCDLPLGPTGSLLAACLQVCGVAQWWR